MQLAYRILLVYFVLSLISGHKQLVDLNKTLDSMRVSVSRLASISDGIVTLDSGVFLPCELSIFT